MKVEVEVEEMYIELQLEALGSQVVIPERGQCSLGAVQKVCHRVGEGGEVSQFGDKW